VSKKIFVVGGARPNFIKKAPLLSQLKSSGLNFKLIHTG